MKELEEVKFPLRGNETGRLHTEASVSVQEIVEGFSLSSKRENESSDPDGAWRWTEGDEETLEQQIVYFVYENPGKSYNALFKWFKEKGFTHTDILEAYNVLIYEKKAIRRLNVGTETSPRYAHFVTELFAREPGKDALYDVLGPL